MEENEKSLWTIVWGGFDRAGSTLSFISSVVKRICLVLSTLFLGLWVYQIIVYVFSSGDGLLSIFLYFIGFVFFLLFPYTSEFYLTWQEEKVLLLGKEVITRKGDLHINGVPYTRTVFWLKLEYDLQRILMLIAICATIFVTFGILYSYIYL